jgi:hypothetical protein
MKNLDITFGRLGNRLFQCAFLYAESRKRGIDWYFQDPKFFESYEEEIKQLFGEGIGYLSQVGVHIRRASNPINPEEPAYHENPFYVDLTKTDYYERAMSMFPEDKFLVFSDDPDWCKEKFKDNPRVQVMEKGNEIDDFNLQSSCKSNIIANSSYSWWCAYLNPYPNKIIVAPSVKNWYTDGVERTKCPSQWIRI